MRNSNSTVILLMNRKSGKDGEFIRNWLEKSRFLSQEVIDIFQAMETISDFTNIHRPEVVLLEVESITDDLPVIQQIADCTAGETEIPFMTVSETNIKLSNSKNYYVGSLQQVETKLDQMFPVHLHFQAVA